MSLEKSLSRSRRLEILHAAYAARLIANAPDGIESDNPDLHRLLRDGHLKEIRPKGERAAKAFEITPKGELFRLDQMDPKERRMEEHRRTFQRPSPNLPSPRYRDLIAERDARRRMMVSGAEAQRTLSRLSAETAALITAALREAEAEPFVLDTGWIDQQEAQRHYLWKMLRNDRHPNDGFTLYNRIPKARTIQIKKRLDGNFRGEFDLMVVRGLGGGAAVCHILEDELVEQQAIHDHLYKEFLAAREVDPKTPEPVYPNVHPKHRFLLLSTGESMNLYLQMAFR